MKYGRTLGLVGLAAIALLALAGSASATIVTSNGSTYTGKFVAQSTTTVQIHRNQFYEGAFNVTCTNSSIEGEVENHGLTLTASIRLTKVQFAECVSAGYITETFLLKPGALEVHTAQGDTEGTSGNGTVTFTGAVFELTTKRVQVGGTGEHCIFNLSNSDIGSIKGSQFGTAGFELRAALSTSLACGLTGELTGSYTISTPDNLRID